MYDDTTLCADADEVCETGAEPSILARAASAATRYRSVMAGNARAHAAGTYADIRLALQAACGQTMPDRGTPAAQALAELIAFAEPGLHATTGSRFFGWVVGASHPLGVAADWLTSAWGQNCGNHQGAPSAAVVEEVAARWLLDVLGLPAQATVGFVSGTTMANFTCLAAARNHVLRAACGDVEADGMFGAPPVDILAGRDAHTSVFHALRMLGFGRQRVRRIETDDNGAMRPEAFHATLDACQGPAIVIAQAGQINTGAFDPVAAILPAIRARGAWLHVDGAFGLWARACPETAHLAAGYEQADSWAVDGHKWLQVPYDAGYAIVAHGDAHRRALTAGASYLPEADGGERDPAQYVPELSRRARGFATWAMLRHLGQEGVAAMVSRHCRLARRMAASLMREPGITVLNDVVLNQVIVRFGTDRPPAIADALTQQTITLIQARGRCFVGGARWRDQWVMRLSVVSWPMQESDADAAVQEIVYAWRAVAR